MTEVIRVSSLLSPLANVRMVLKLGMHMTSARTRS